jgi:hypothetical protein
MALDSSILLSNANLGGIFSWRLGMQGEMRSAKKILLEKPEGKWSLFILTRK